MKRIPGFVAVLFFCTLVCVRAQDNVLPPELVDSGKSLILIDTAGVPRDVSKPGDLLSGELYAHGKWVIWFTVDAIKLPPAPRDSIVRITWDAIDTAYPEMRAGFQALEEQFGPFHLDKRLPHKVSGIESQKFYLWFENYVNVTKVNMALSTIPGTKGGFGDMPGQLLYTPDDPGLRAGIEYDQVIASGADSFWPENLNFLGFHWNLYRTNLPMAWEITKGSPSVVIAMRDEFWTCLRKVDRY